jgi:integrase
LAADQIDFWGAGCGKPMAVNLRKRGEIWYLDFYHKGKRHQRSAKTSQRKLAEQLAKEIEVQIFKGQFKPNSEIKSRGTDLVSLFRRYIDHSRSTKAKTTQKTDRVAIKVWQDYFARKGINSPSQITHRTITDFQIENSQIYSARYFNNLLGCLKTVLNYGIEWGFLEFNPISKYKKLKIPKKLRFYTDEEVKKFWGLASPRVQAIIALGLYAGLRRAEIVSLRWDDIDWNRGMLHIRSDDQVTPKGKRPRSIPIHKTLHNTLKAYRGDSKTNGWVFPRMDGRIGKLGLNAPTREFAEVLKQAGIRGRLHDLRHTFGSRLVRESVPLPVVKELMGHADIESTMIYVHLAPAQFRDAIDQLSP